MPTRECKTCGEVKPLDQFVKDCRGRDGFRTQCRACRNAVAARWLHSHPQNRKAYGKSYYQRHRKELAQKSRVYYQANQAQIREQQRQHREQNPRLYWRSHLQRRYGMTPEEYDHIYRSQGGLCALCGQPETQKNKHMGVDHNHETGKVRGLLCHKCNRALGLFQDSPELMEKAATYVRQY